MGVRSLRPSPTRPSSGRLRRRSTTNVGLRNATPMAVESLVCDESRNESRLPGRRGPSVRWRPANRWRSSCAARRRGLPGPSVLRRPASHRRASGSQRCRRLVALRGAHALSAASRGRESRGSQHARQSWEYARYGQAQPCLQADRPSAGRLSQTLGFAMQHQWQSRAWSAMSPASSLVGEFAAGRPSGGGRRTVRACRAVFVGEVCAGRPSFGGQRAIGSHQAVSAASGSWHSAMLVRCQPRSRVASPELCVAHGRAGSTLATVEPNPVFKRTGLRPAA
jgi:hypothetical protein